MSKLYRRIRSISFLLLAFAAITLISGCEGDSSAGPGEQYASISAWVVNSLGQTLSKLNLETGQVTNNIVETGEGANEILIEGDKAYVVNSLENNFQIIDLITGQTIGTIEILQGVNPYYAALEGTERAFVSNLLSGNVSVLDLAANSETGVINTGGIPEGVCVAGDYLYVTDVVDYSGNWQPGKVYAYDLATLTLQSTATVGINPQIVKMGPDGNLHVICTGDYNTVVGEVDIVDPISMMVMQSMTLGGTPGSLVFTSDGIGYVGGGGWSGDGSVYSYDALTYTVVHDSNDPIVVPSPALGLSITQDDNVLVCCFNSDELVKLDSAGELLGTYAVGDGPISVAVFVP